MTSSFSSDALHPASFICRRFFHLFCRPFSLSVLPDLSSPDRRRRHRHVSHLPYNDAATKPPPVPFWCATSPPAPLAHTAPPRATAAHGHALGGGEHREGDQRNRVRFHANPSPSSFTTPSPSTTATGPGPSLPDPSAGLVTPSSFVTACGKHYPPLSRSRLRCWHLPVPLAVSVRFHDQLSRQLVHFLAGGGVWPGSGDHTSCREVLMHQRTRA